MKNQNKTNRTYGIWIFSIIAFIFGVMTLKSGGAVLFVDGEGRMAAGNYVPFVLWFNFIAGFIYIYTAITLWLLKPLAARLSLLLTVATLIIFAALGLHILTGGAYEMRTVYAMIFRSVIWIIMAVFTWKHFTLNHTFK